jgi:hypothetical protein
MANFWLGSYLPCNLASNSLLLLMFQSGVYQQVKGNSAVNVEPNFNA